MGTTQPKIYNFDFHFEERKENSFTDEDKDKQEGEAPPPIREYAKKNSNGQYDIYLDKVHNKKSLKISNDIYNFNFHPPNHDNNNKNANNSEKSNNSKKNNKNNSPINSFFHNIDPNISQSVQSNNNKKKIFCEEEKNNYSFHDKGKKCANDKEKETTGETNNIDPNKDIGENYKKKEINADNEVNVRKNETFGNPSEDQMNYGKNYYNNDKETETFGKQENIDVNKDIGKDENRNDCPMKNNCDDKEDLGISRSVLLGSYENLDITDDKDKEVLKALIQEKINEGYVPIFLKYKNQYTYYYIKLTSTLKSLLYAHLEYIGETNNGGNYSLYYKESKIDETIPIEDLKLSYFATINVIA